MKMNTRESSGKYQHLLLVVVAFMGIMILCCEVEMVSANLSDAQCHEERRVGLNACKPVLAGKLPSAACCQRVRVTHIECVCQVITPKIAALVDINRAIRLVEGCGRRVPRHYKCGSKLLLTFSLCDTVLVPNPSLKKRKEIIRKNI